MDICSREVVQAHVQACCRGDDLSEILCQLADCRFAEVLRGDKSVHDVLCGVGFFSIGIERGGQHVHGGDCVGKATTGELHRIRHKVSGFTCVHACRDSLIGRFRYLICRSPISDRKLLYLFAHPGERAIIHLGDGLHLCHGVFELIGRFHALSERFDYLLGSLLEGLEHLVSGESLKGFACVLYFLSGFLGLFTELVNRCSAMVRCVGGFIEILVCLGQFCIVVGHVRLGGVQACLVEFKIPIEFVVLFLCLADFLALLTVLLFGFIESDLLVFQLVLIALDDPLKSGDLLFRLLHLLREDFMLSFQRFFAVRRVLILSRQEPHL